MPKGSGSGPRGPQGPQGEQGPVGPQGPATGSELSAIQLTNSDITTSLNTAALTDIPFDALDIINGTDFTHSGVGVMCNFDGIIDISGSIFLEGAASRASIAVRIAINGAVLPFIFNQSYLRNTSGQIESGTGLPSVLANVTDGDVITLQSIRQAVSGQVDMFAVGSSFFRVERVH